MTPMKDGGQMVTGAHPDAGQAWQYSFVISNLGLLTAALLNNDV
jgi:hypothetical protein